MTFSKSLTSLITSLPIDTNGSAGSSYRARRNTIHNNHRMQPIQPSKKHSHRHSLTFETAAFTMNRVKGTEDIFIGGMEDLYDWENLDHHKITHILSLQEPRNRGGLLGRSIRNRDHLVLQVDDDVSTNMLRHFPAIVEYMEAALHPAGTASPPASAAGSPRTPAPPASPTNAGAVLVHCTLGQSRSVAAVIAYLMHRHPTRFAYPCLGNRHGLGRETALEVLKAVGKTRAKARPNDGFMEQLALWWEIGCPVEGLETNATYRQWLLEKESELAAGTGRAPVRVTFADEKAPAAPRAGEKQIRCGGCDYVLVPSCPEYVTRHRSNSAGLVGTVMTPQGIRKSSQAPPTCSYHFVEPLGWMHDELDRGHVEGWLDCPGCRSRVGRYHWEGFRCDCGQESKPSIALRMNRVRQCTLGGDESSSV